MKVALFIGSGVSTGCGLPDTGEITRSLFEEEWYHAQDEWYKRTLKYFHPGKDPNPLFQQENIVLRIKSFLRILHNHAAKYLKNKNSGKPTYEDLYSLVAQIYAEQKREINNPAIIPFCDIINKKAEGLFEPLGVGKEALTLGDLSGGATRYIKDVIRDKLSTKAIPEKLGLILEMARDKTISRLDIYTLNHDSLIENLFENYNIKYADGFGQPTHDIRRDDHATYDSNIKVKLYKLHGSINWCHLMNETIEDPLSYMGMPIKDDVADCKGSDGNPVIEAQPERYFLTGTYNKLIDYGSWPYAGILTRFQSSIEEHDRLIVSGYGWNDPGINSRIFGWIGSRDSRKIICLHRDFLNELEKKSATKMQCWHGALKEQNRSVIINKWLSEVSFSEIKEHL